MYQNVRYELHGLEKLFAKGASGVHEPEGLFAAVPKPDFVSKEAARIRQSFLQNVFTFEDESHLARYIRYHQQALISLMDETYCRSGPESLPDGYETLEGLLAFIEQHFSAYFDLNAKAPESYIAVARKNAAQDLDTIETRLSMMNADPGISDIALGPLRKLVRGSTSCNTYRAIRYAAETQKELLKLTAAEKTSCDMDTLLQLMYYLNLNSKHCYVYITNRILETISQLETKLEKTEKLYSVLRHVSQAPERADMPYNQDAPSLKTQVSLYIYEEISYIERVLKLAPEKPCQSAENPFREFKLKLDISVSQLAFLVRLLLDGGIIQNTNIAEVLRFIATYAVTKRSESISISSFRNKFYEVEWSTRQSVGELLTNLIRRAGKNP